MSYIANLDNENDLVSTALDGKIDIRLPGEHLTLEQAEQLVSELCWELAKRYEDSDPSKYDALMEAFDKLTEREL